MSERTSDYDYSLPPELIATRPLERRDASRMMVLHRASATIEHRNFSDFSAFLKPGDLVVLNDSKVIRARIFSDDGRIELLLLEGAGPLRWRSMVKPARRTRIGATFTIGGIGVQVIGVVENGDRILEFAEPVDLDRLGHLPIPPYLRRASDQADDERYQTVFAQTPGSVAAPTAGLHFTPEALATFPHTFLTLHVGPGTFAPVRADRLRDHAMHEERYAITPGAAKAINAARRIVAIGTTVTRVLESQPPGPLIPHSGKTGLFIYPPFKFHHIHALLTNFHLPRSSLLMLVSAFAGREFTFSAYNEAIRQRYRFYSYGDCMLVL